MHINQQGNENHALCDFRPCLRSETKRSCNVNDQITDQPQDEHHREYPNTAELRRQVGRLISKKDTRCPQRSRK